MGRDAYRASLLEAVTYMTGQPVVLTARTETRPDGYGGEHVICRWQAAWGDQAIDMEDLDDLLVEVVRSAAHQVEQDRQERARQALL